MNERIVVAIAPDMNIGNKILELLIFEGWEVFSSDSVEAASPDRGWHGYKLKNGEQTIEFSWDDQFGWLVSGPEFTVRRLAKDFRLRLKK